MNLRIFSLLTLISCLLVSCATTGGNPQVVRSHQEFKSRKTYTQGIIIRGTQGALLGAVANGVKMHNGKLYFDSDAAARGAVVGGVAGGTVGAVEAHKKVQARKQYRDRGISLENSIKQTRSTRTAAASFNRTLAAEVRKAHAGDASLKGTLNHANSVLREVNREIDDQNKRINGSQGVSVGELRELKIEVNRLQHVKRDLEYEIDRIHQKANVSTVP